MNHNEYKELLSALLDGELSEAERETALAHLDACEDCRAYFAELNAMRAALEELDEYDAPEGFAEGVMERVRKEGAKKVPDRREPVRSRRPRRAWGALAACAAVVVLAISALPNALRMGSKSASTEAAPAATAPMMAAPVAPPDEFRAAAVADGSVEETAPAASEYGVNALYAAGTAPAEPTAPAGGASDESKVRVASDSGVPMTVVTAGPNGETVPAPGAAATEEAVPTLTLRGEGAAAWLAENGWQGESGDWYVTANALAALPEGLELEGVAPPDDAGAVRIELAEETEARP